MTQIERPLQINIQIFSSQKVPGSSPSWISPYEVRLFYLHSTLTVSHCLNTCRLGLPTDKLPICLNVGPRGCLSLYASPVMTIFMQRTQRTFRQLEMKKNLSISCCIMK